MDIGNIVDLFKGMTEDQLINYFVPSKIRAIKIAIRVVEADGNCLVQADDDCANCFLPEMEKCTCDMLKSLHGAKYFLTQMFHSLTQGPIQPAVKSITLDCTIIQDWPVKETKNEVALTPEEEARELNKRNYQETIKQLHKLINDKVTIINKLRNAKIDVTIDGVNITNILPAQVVDDIMKHVTITVKHLKETTETELDRILTYAETASPQAVVAVYGNKE
jgi:hypothetical protein